MIKMESKMLIMTIENGRLVFKHITQKEYIEMITGEKHDRKQTN